MSDDTFFEGLDYDDIQHSVEAQLGSTPNGWSGLVVDLFEHIKTRCDENEIAYPDVRQIKTKFGELRIYCRTEDETIRGWISATLQKANHSCEQCGNSASMQRLDSVDAVLCVWCAHEIASARHPERKRLFGDRKRPVRDANTCHVCGYHGQIDRSDDNNRCPACTKKDW